MKLLLTVLFIVTTSASIGQKAATYVLHLDKLELKEKIALPFAAITVIDARLDQSNIGCVVKNLSFKGMTEQKMPALFPEDLTTYLPKVLQTVVRLNPSSNDTLVILVKQFRIADHLFNTIEKYHETESVLTVSFSFYLADKSRLVKIASVNEMLAEPWTAAEKIKEETIPAVRNEALRVMLRKLLENRSWVPSETAFLLSEVEEGLKKRYTQPVFTDKVPVAGLYKTFQEFLNNSPSVFNVKIGRFNDQVMEVRDSDFNLIGNRTFWGLCDGNKKYVSFQGNIYELEKISTSFRLRYHRRENEKIIGTGDDVKVNVPAVGSITPVGMINSLKKNVRTEYLYLNLETGKVHVEEIVVAGKTNANNE